ncbi:MAG: hypothetical protein OEY93_01270 [Anaerolineae bacterium]|nr:hypothetical protein [Anaerolineae bacterium]
MSKANLESWTVKYLPNMPEGSTPTYQFWIGPREDLRKDKLYLQISEIPNRSAEGRPLYPEQAAWVRNAFKTQNIQAKEIWYSTWEFKNNVEAGKFKRLLDGLKPAKGS